mgnify:CR=1 FL=1
MSRLKRFSMFAFVGSTVAPGIAATLHFSPLVSAVSLLLALPVVLLTYYTVKTGWEDQGLYAYVRRANLGLSRAFLVLWSASYYLYVVYTAIYVPYYVLGLDGVIPVVLSLAIAVSVSLLVSFADPLYAFPAIFLVQVAFSLPFGWKPGVGFGPTDLNSLFVDVLSSSLIVVCITLSTFVRGDAGRDSPFILYAFAIFAVVLLYGSFLVPTSATVVASSLGSYGLILAELTAINNLLRPTATRGGLVALNFSTIPLVLLGNINYSAFYNSLIVPSLSFLYLSLFVFAVSTLASLRGFRRVLSLVSAGLFAYGEYSVVAEGTGYLLYEAIASLLAGVVIITLSAMKVNKVHDKNKK